jgi:hypothetical protein
MSTHFLVPGKFWGESTFKHLFSERMSNLPEKSMYVSEEDNSMQPCSSAVDLKFCNRPSTSTPKLTLTKRTKKKHNKDDKLEKALLESLKPLDDSALLGM